ncbi:MAG: alginate export family protein [Gemmatimonadetes bacterium]|nr:alginate export family protein [Gemmatimonadota bacterium]NNM06626.1 alginate export family protein [Gemmatimonadota bacterium]
MTLFLRSHARIRPFLAFALVLFAGLVQPAPSLAQVRPVLSLGGEVRPRLFGREPVLGQWDHWISMRTRVELKARFQSGFGLFFQAQDVRFWGEELSNRDASADRLDFHQAYLEVDSVPGIGGSFRAGRQEVALGEGRFISAPDWGQAGQSFDGVRWLRPMGEASVELVYLRLQEGSSSGHDTSADFTALAFSSSQGSLGSVDFLAVHDRTGGSPETSRTTIGPTWWKRSGIVSFRFQAMKQFGEAAGRDISATMLAGRATLHWLDDRARLTLWYDRLSGDSDPTDNTSRSFSTLFGARHRYYGRSDFFLDIPEDTGGLGLRDRALKMEYYPTDLLSVYLDFHSFRTDEQGALSDRNLAEEIDLWVQYRFRDTLDLEVGYSFTRAGAAMEELGRLDGTANLAYFMTSLRF